MGERSKSGVKSAAVLVGALAFAWLAIEMALKPFLSRAREGIRKSGPACDPDSDKKAASAAAEEQKGAKEEGKEGGEVEAEEEEEGVVVSPPPLSPASAPPAAAVVGED